MSLSTNSQYISVLDFGFTLDLSVSQPVAFFENMSTVSDASQLDWTFELLSPSMPIYQGALSSPDIQGAAFTTWNVPGTIPLRFGQIEFSNSGKYTAKVTVVDSDGKSFTLSKSKSACKPNGNNGKNNYGGGDIEIETRCHEQDMWVRDRTNYLYKGIEGTLVSKNLKVSYPKDESGNAHADVELNIIDGLVPIYCEGEGYKIFTSAIYRYDLGDYFFVKVKYLFQDNSFAVWCNIDVCPLLCEIDSLAEGIAANCDIESKREQSDKLGLINLKLSQVILAKLYPLQCRLNAAKLVEEIKEIGQFNCDCCRPGGLVNQGVGVGSNLAFIPNRTCGDINLAFSVSGNNITVTYSNTVYVFQLDANPENSSAFTITPSTSGCTKTFKFFVNLGQLASEIITKIENSETLANRIRALIAQSALTCNGIDGKSIFNSTTSNYSLKLNTSLNSSIITEISISGTTYAAPANLLVTNATGIAAWLNSLSKGVFVATYNAGLEETTITSANNLFTVAYVSVLPPESSAEFLYYFVSDKGAICNILQKLIDYMDALNLSKVKVGGNISVCYVDTDGSIKQKAFNSTDASTDNKTAFQLLSFMATSLCSALNLAKTGGISCDGLKSMFAEFTEASENPSASDYVFAVVKGKCQKLPIKNLGIGIFNLLGSDTEVKDIYCGVATCTTVKNCNNVTNLTITPSNTSATATWDSVIGAVGYKWSKDGTTFNFTATASAVITGLTASTNYTFRVYPVYNNGDGTDCTVLQSFNTTASAGTCAAPTGFVSSNIYDVSARISWSAVAGATSYEYNINGGSYVNVGNVLTTVLYGLTASTAYTVTVRAVVSGSPCPQLLTGNFTTGAPFEGMICELDSCTTPDFSGGLKREAYNLLNSNFQYNGAGATISAVSCLLTKTPVPACLTSCFTTSGADKYFVATNDSRFVLKVTTALVQLLYVGSTPLGVVTGDTFTVQFDCENPGIYP